MGPVESMVFAVGGRGERIFYAVSARLPELSGPSAFDCRANVC